MKRERKSLIVWIFFLAIVVAGCSKRESHVFSSLKDPATAAQLKQFVAQKKTQADAAGDKLTPEFDEFYAAAQKGDWLAVSNRFGPLMKRARSEGLSGSRVATLLEVDGALEAFAGGDEKYSVLYGSDIINSIPPGSIYFGGTDPGRFVITAMQKSQVDGDPFFTLTQNGLADPTYLDYLRSMYGSKIYIPTAEDSQNCFQEYSTDAEQRRQKHQLKPGEEITRDASGKLQVRGQISVMEINGLIAKVIFDKNPDHEFYIEESFPLDWMYPYLEPHGIILKLNHRPVTSLADEVVQSDHDCWTKYATQMIGGWLHDGTSVQSISEFAGKVFLQKDFGTYGVDRRFIENTDAQKWFSKERSSIGGLYAWRADHASGDGEKQRMTDAADFAFRQAFALCPYSPEAVYRYVNLLVEQKRFDDALLIAQTAAKFKFPGAQFQSLVAQLKRQKGN